MRRRPPRSTLPDTHCPYPTLFRSRLVYVDAFLPEHGESAFDQMAPAFVATLKKRAADRGEGWAIASNDGKGPPQPIGTLEERISLTNAAAAAIPGTNILKMDQGAKVDRMDAHTTELQHLMRNSDSV